MNILPGIQDTGYVPVGNVVCLVLFLPLRLNLQGVVSIDATCCDLFNNYSLPGEPLCNGLLLEGGQRPLTRGSFVSVQRLYMYTKVGA